MLKDIKIEEVRFLLANDTCRSMIYVKQTALLNMFV